MSSVDYVCIISLEIRVYLLRGSAEINMSTDRLTSIVNYTNVHSSESMGVRHRDITCLVEPVKC